MKTMRPQKTRHCHSSWLLQIAPTRNGKVSAPRCMNLVELFSQVPDANGSLKLTHGALIPEGYQLSATTPKYPWICPIRPCRKVFVGLVQLGGHFIVSKPPCLGHCARLTPGSEHTEARVYMTIKMGPFRCAVKPFFVVGLRKGQPKNSRPLLFPGAPPTPLSRPL
jgi:hypothetical protein